MQTKPKYHRWNFSSEIILLQNWDGAKSAEKIARLLDVDSSRVLEKAHQLRLGEKGWNSKWKQEELDYLSILAETSTLNELTKKYNLWAKQRKYQYRTKEAIEKKIKLMGFSVKPLIGYVSLKELTGYLGRTHRYMQGLIEASLLPVHRVGTNYIYVKEKDFINFAKKYPLEVGEKMTTEGMIWFLQILNNED